MEESCSFSLSVLIYYRPVIISTLRFDQIKSLYIFWYLFAWFGKRPIYRPISAGRCAIDSHIRTSTKTVSTSARIQQMRARAYVKACVIAHRHHIISAEKERNPISNQIDMEMFLQQFPSAVQAIQRLAEYSWSLGAVAIAGVFFSCLLFFSHLFAPETFGTNSKFYLVYAKFNAQTSIYENLIYR